MCFGLTGLAPISRDGALSPWQWILERLEKIEDAPSDDDIIIEPHKTTNLQEMGDNNQDYDYTQTVRHTMTQWTSRTIVYLGVCLLLSHPKDCERTASSHMNY